MDVTPGLQYGLATVLGREMPPPGRSWASHGRRWTLRCMCGTLFTATQTRLVGQAPPAGCSNCAPRRCVVCDGLISTRLHPSNVTCGAPSCRRATANLRNAAYHARAASDPKRRARLAGYAATYRNRHADDPAWTGAKRTRDAAYRARMAADPVRSAAQAAYKREWASRNREARLAARQAYLDSLTPDQLQRWLRRARAYMRAYQQRWMEEVRRDPDRHRAYLDMQAEWRRRHRLATAMSVLPAMEAALG